MALKTTAQTKQDVDEMSVRDRLWDSMNYSYGQKLNQSNAAYDKAISQNDRAMLARGMQRSSYGAQTRAGLMNQKVDAANAIESEKIADYENRLYQVERDEIEDAFKNKQFDEGVRQFNENLAFQQSEAQRAQGNWEVEQAFRVDQWNTQKKQWEQEFNYNKKTNDQKLAYESVVAIVQNGKDPSPSLLKRAGLSKSDASKMKKAVSSGGGYYYKKPSTTDKNGNKGQNVSDKDLFTTPPPTGTPAGANGGNPQAVSGNTLATAATGVTNNATGSRTVTPKTNNLVSKKAVKK